ncbi:VIT family protein [Bordetella sputigena]|uniref:VIT1/CCC1 transporter family protein n=1 Tax=Bordetella sputigena TaxID=1416810 RepID=UPI0039EEBDB2
MPAPQHHRIHRTGWLRAAVLGANDGIVSTASLIAGVAAAAGSHGAILTAGLAGLVAGALSMAAGEYVSVKSQSDIEHADLKLEQSALLRNSADELQELADIYVNRGVPPDLAMQVARALTAHDALDAHARDELGISKNSRARPVQAAVASALSFATGAVLPLVLAVLSPDPNWRLPVVATGSVACLAALGAVAAWAGGAPKGKAVLRVVLLGAAAIVLTAGVGSVFGVAA